MNQTESQALTRAGSSSLEQALLSYSRMLHQDLSRNRFAEEREWYELALFYQRRQWLSWDKSSKRWNPIEVSKSKPVPMPVTNHFKKTINTNANQLSGGNTTYVAIPNDDSAKNRRAGEAAEKAGDAIDIESGFLFQEATLAKHVALWGIGVTVDQFMRNESEGVVKVPVMELQQAMVTGCMDCAFVGYSDDTPGNCPSCGSSNTTQWQSAQPQVSEVKQFSQGKIRSEVRPIFEFFLPRDCVNPNLARKKQRKYRKPLSEAKDVWGEKAADLKAEEKHDIPEIYMEALRSLVNYNYMHEQTAEGVSVVETWVQWDQLPDDLQEKLEQAAQQGVDDQGNEVTAPDPELDPVEQLHKWGIYSIEAGDTMLDWGINPNEGECPWTFFTWEADPANVYSTGVGADCTPIQKRLNRLDSLIELAMMSNGAGKWLWPSTQTSAKPSGSPSDVIDYDVIGDGKIAPQFVVPTPVSPQAYALRQAIIQDFREIGLTEGVAQGVNPQGVNSFRGIAYLGAKASEQISTQRKLWEMACELRMKKCIRLAKNNWDEPRKVKVAGYNGKWGMSQLSGQDLDGDYTFCVKEGSSRPRTPEDKAQRVAMLLQAGLLDPTDPQTRDYILDESGLENLDLTDALQYRKAERDLDKVIHGIAPLPVPAVNVQIYLKTFNDFTLTEEFEELDRQSQARVLSVVEFLTQQVQQMQMQQMEQQRAQEMQRIGGAMAQHGQQQSNNALNGVPGQNTTPEASSAGALQEGSQIAAQVP